MSKRPGRPGAFAILVEIILIVPKIPDRIVAGANVTRQFFRRIRGNAQEIEVTNMNALELRIPPSHNQRSRWFDVLATLYGNPQSTVAQNLIIRRTEN